MTQREQVYLCEICGNIVEVLHVGRGQLVCCNQPMTLQVENTVDASYEKHVPQVTRDGETIRVQVGSTLHPMTEEHYIEWIELIAGDVVERHYLSPGDLPETSFVCKNVEQPIIRAYCNLHGLWKAATE
ncbi:MAG: desulfoferrodoxin [Firmicutes bacterium]|nr:desulfoferrodoxin [Bacillota bacterium]